MGRYLRRARHHVEKITHYYNHAGEAGYAQAKHHWFELSDLLVQASRSKSDKSDADDIQLMMKSAESKVEEMKLRERGEDGGTR